MTFNHVRLTALAIILAATASGTALHAQGLLAAAAKIEPRAVEEKDVVSGKTKLDPAKGYIFISGVARQFGMFLRVPDEATRAEWEKDREKAFGKALKSYRSELALWQANAAQLKEHKMKSPDAPVEPALETFQFDPIDLRDQVGFGPQFVYAKGETVSYMQAVKPGTYIWYGPVLGGAGVPAGGVCTCMGTVRFDVKAGAVTDLGNWLLAAPEPDEIHRQVIQQANDKRIAAGKKPLPPVERPEIKFGLPASLKDWPSVQAEFHANGKLNNLFGIMISRLLPVPGVLGYHRDTIVDLRTGQEIESPTLISRAKIKK
ncbi:hypothetical protein [Novosphingobium sp. PASSN1]|uniref:hypothetical protein n=1 Tax=Novosphingobium sp. PASSN1 TaxID=2015561 RepID=UPI000BC476FB|nr:hypothetical protein [Novosphingobium sp. PASSN1]OYU34620.1 MAG: hypothetical protein CFE35_14675 [Novosphingobium sp. PASSN1]